MRRKKPSMSDSESDRIFLLTHSVGMTTEQLMEKVLQDVKQMSPDEKAHLRAKLSKNLRFAPKTSGGKPS